MGDEDLQLQLDIKNSEVESLTDALSALQEQHEKLGEDFDEQTDQLEATRR